MKITELQNISQVQLAGAPARVWSFPRVFSAPRAYAETDALCAPLRRARITTTHTAAACCALERAAFHLWARARDARGGSSASFLVVFFFSGGDEFRESSINNIVYYISEVAVDWILVIDERVTRALHIVCLITD